jgi:uncharacterized protein (DUF983 family)
MNMMKGICPKCGVTYCGWALSTPEFQKCERCGCDLEIYKDGMRIAVFVSPDTAPVNKIADKKTKEEITTLQ